MFNILSMTHIGIRISNKQRTIDFYKLLGFQFIRDIGFKQGHPFVMKHPCGVALNFLGPTTIEDQNILMDVQEKYAGYTHISLQVDSIEKAKDFFADHGIKITSSFSTQNLHAIFIRDPDRNVIQFDEYID